MNEEGFGDPRSWKTVPESYFDGVLRSAVVERPINELKTCNGNLQTFYLCTNANKICFNFIHTK